MQNIIYYLSAREREWVGNKNVNICTPICINKYWGKNAREKVYWWYRGMWGQGWVGIECEGNFSTYRILYHLTLESCDCAKSLPSYLTLCDPVDSSLSGSSVHGILQARILEWVAMPSSRRSFLPRDQTLISYGRQVLYH